MVIYKRTNIINGKVYIGQSIRKESVRWKESVSDAKLGKGFLLGRAIRKYGQEVFKSEVIYIARSKHELDMMETFFIVLYQSHLSENGYNIISIGRGGITKMLRS